MKTEDVVTQEAALPPTELELIEIQLLKKNLEFWQDQACDFEATFTKAELRHWCGEVIFVFIAGTVFGALVVAFAK